MVKVIGIRFKSVGKIYYFDPDGQSFNTGDGVIVETARGTEFGHVAMTEKEIDETRFSIPIKKILRKATDADKKTLEENKKKEKEAYDICLSKIRANKLDMNLIDVEYTFDSSKILFYFTADGRVDFRQLVKDLASVFRTRIELRQIGVRDEAKMRGGLGICGRPLCCSLFLGDFEPVSIKMAKEQSLSLNPTKISGTCGRLMCCLKYEQDAYEALLKETPNVGAIVQSPAGKGTVVSTNLLKGLAQVKLEEGPENTVSEFKVSELTVIKDSMKRNQDAEIDLSTLKELEE
ncbi:MAG: stage 0 sporulation family protein [Clostridia bacterium]|nr:stage 0 sporulation family protein [Clostridia bacterium]